MTPDGTRAARGEGEATRAGRAHVHRMDPRISARRTAVTREQGRRRLRVLVIGLAGAACLVGVWFLLHSPLFSARSVTVTGNVHETAAQVVAQAGLTSRPPLLDVDAGAAAARIEELPWVRTRDGTGVLARRRAHRGDRGDAAFRGQRLPAANWESLSNDGRVLSVSATRPPGLLLLAVPEAPGAPGTELSAKDASGLRVAATLPASFATQVTAVTVEPAGWVQLAMTTPIVVDIGSAAELTAKYEDVSSILAGATLHNGDVIDVSVPDAPTVTTG